MSRKSANRERELHQKKLRQEIRETNYLLEGMSRGGNPSKLYEKLEHKSERGIESESIVQQAMDVHPLIYFVEKTDPFADRTQKVDFRAGIILPEGRIRVAVQVKSSDGGADRFYDFKANQFGKPVEMVDNKLIRKNIMVIVPGLPDQDIESRKAAVRKQVDEWVERKQKL